MIKNIKWLVLVSLTIVACSGDEDIIKTTAVAEVPATPGSANFSKYVALGDSFAAGFSDRALFKAGQENAYPNLLAKQFAMAGGGAFATPFMADNIGGLLFGGAPFPLDSTQFTPRLVFNGFKGSSPDIGLVSPQGSQKTEATTILKGPFNNMGVPGAKSYHLVTPGYGSSMGNPYFARFASNPGTTVLADALAQDPTFFSLWVGGNDVLGYATSGGTGKNQTGNPNRASYGSNDITDPMVFADAYDMLITGLISKATKGVVANIPYVNNLPFFTAVAPNAIPGLPAASAAQLNQLFGGINAALKAAGQPARFETLVADDNNALTAEKNPVLIVDENLFDVSAQITATLTPLFGAPTATYLGSIYGKARHAKSTADSRDFILLTAGSLLGTELKTAPAPFNVIGVSNPLQDKDVLISSEVAEIKVATDAYNTTIKSLADAKGLAFVDAKLLMEQLSKVIVRNSLQISSAFITGGVFSYDGIHPGPRGYALIANELSIAINAKYGATLKQSDVGAFQIQYTRQLP